MCSRRSFLRFVGLFLLTGCATSRTTDGVVAGQADRRTGDPLYVENARAYLVAVPDGAAAALRDLLPTALHAGLDAGVLALSQKCPVDGCRLPFCTSSGWFECGCDGERFTELGASRSARATQGMGMFQVEVNDAGEVVIDTSHRFRGLPRDSYDTETEAVGPHCVGGA